MNPEIKRSAWEELSLRRLIAMPLILGAIFSLPASLGGGTADLAAVLFIVITLFWGTRQAADAVPTEVSERTWDWQRLSTLSAWQLTWGKLFGSTLFSWYGGLICLIVFVLGDEQPDLVRDAYIMVIASLLAQSVAFLLGLQTVRLRGHRTRVGTLVSQLFGIVIGFWALQAGNVSDSLAVLSMFTDGITPAIVWYGFRIDPGLFANVSLVLFLLWSVLGGWRLMKRELQYPTRPWAWPAFTLFCCIYAAGHFSPGGDLIDLFDLDVFSGRLVVAAIVSGLLTYVALFWEDKDPVQFRRLLRMAGSGKWAAVLANTQSWMVSYALTILIVVVLLITASTGEVGGVTLWAAMIGALLFMARDIAINLYFWLAPRPGRANISTLIALGILYWVLPITFSVGGDGSLFLFYSFAPAEPFMVLAASGVQAGVMAFVVMQRWSARFALQPS